MWDQPAIISTSMPAAIQWRQTAATGVDSLLLDDVKTWLNRPLEDTFWDAETTRLISIAVKAIEAHCQLTIAPSTFVGTLPLLPEQFRISKRPFHSLERIDYVDAVTGTVTQLDASSYMSAPIAQACGLVVMGDGVLLPTVATRPDAVRLTVKTGFYGLDGVTAELPIEIKHAISMCVAELDANRGDDGGGGGGNTTVYAMKQVRGGYLNQSIRDLLAPWTYQSFIGV